MCPSAAEQPVDASRVDTTAPPREGVAASLSSHLRHERLVPMVVVVFKITHRPDMPRDDYEQTGNRMVELVQSMPGFLGMDYAATDDGELLIVRFESHEALAAW